MKHLEKLVKIALKAKCFYYVDYGEVSDLAKLHKYVTCDEDFVFFIELAYECEVGVETLIGWAEDVRQEELSAKAQCDYVRTATATEQPF